MSSGTVNWQGVLALLGLMVARTVAAEPGDFPIVSLSTGINVTSGDYGGTADIDDLEVPLAFSIDYERWAFTAKVPYLSVRTTERGVETTESGLGDVTVGLTLFDLASDVQRGLALDATGTVKFGTADKNTYLGTGENDYSLYFDGYKFYDSLTLLGSIGYQWRGSSPELPLNDVFLGTIGTIFRSGGDVLFGVMFDYRESALADTSDIQELRGFASFPLGEDWMLECHAFSGLTDSSADWGGGIAIATQLRRFGFRTVD